MSEPVTEFKLTTVRRADAPPLALVTIDNGADHTRPTVFDRAALESLARVLDALETEEWGAVVITGKPYVFAAGADLDELPRLRTAELARQASRAGHELFGRVRALPCPTLAAINGACLGGGVELALHCDLRTISSAVRHFACPECLLGIVPAWGATQLAPRLVGAETAIRFIVENPLRQNAMLSARAAHELGFADQIFEPVEFLDESLALALELARTGETRPRAWRGDASGAAAVEKARARLDDSVHGAPLARYRALDLIEGALSGWSIEDGYRAEEEALAELLPGPQARASLYAYDLVERRAKGRPQLAAEPRPVAKVGIVGAGLMARQLAPLFLRRLEVPIVLCDLDHKQVEEALTFVRSELDALVARGRCDEGKGRFLKSLVTGSTGYDGFADCDLVLEAVFEQLEVKRHVFAAVETVVAPEAVLATNTSALSVGAIGADLAHPERLAGMHFFNPVAILPLVEIVRAERTGDAAVATLDDVARRLRKRPLLVADAPGFVVNRVLTRLLTVVLAALERGNTPREVDAAILQLGLPIAPSVLLQMVGPRVALHVVETLHAAFPDRFPLSQTLANYAEGREEVALVADAPWPPDEILERALDALEDELERVVADGVVADVADVDTALILGAGFPFWLGGISKQLEQRSASARMMRA